MGFTCKILNPIKKAYSILHLRSLYLNLITKQKDPLYAYQKHINYNIVLDITDEYYHCANRIINYSYKRIFKTAIINANPTNHTSLEFEQDRVLIKKMSVIGSSVFPFVLVVSVVWVAFAETAFVAGVVHLH